MTSPGPEVGIIARNIEVSFLFPESATAAVHTFLRERLSGYSYRRYEIADTYFEMPRDAATTTLVRRRVEITGQKRVAAIIAPCGADRYLIAADDLTAEVQNPMLDVTKDRDDWTLRWGSRLAGRHFGSFVRASIDIGETIAPPRGEPRRTFPGSNVVEFEYAGVGKRDNGFLVDAFLVFCRTSSIETTQRTRGAAHRMAILRAAKG